MKELPQKRRKTVKDDPEDTISQTISFVIKGKLTPIKPSLVSKKLGRKVMDKKSKVTKPKATKVATKKTAKKTLTDSQVPRIRKLRNTNPDSKVQLKSTRPGLNKTKSNKQKTVAQGASNADDVTGVDRTLNENSQNPSQNDVKNDAVKVTKKIPKNSKSIKTLKVSERKLKKDVANKPVKQVQKSSIKLKTKESKKLDKSNVDDQINSEEDIKKKTIEKLLMQANKVLKQSKIKTVKPKSEFKPKVLAKLKKVGVKVLKPGKKLVVKKPKLAKIVKAKPKENEIKQISVKTEVKSEKVEGGDLSCGSSSDEITLAELGRQPNEPKSKIAKKEVKIKEEKASIAKSKVKRKLKPKQLKVKETNKSRKLMKLYGFWTGPKKHRVASLNALAKVHCLYDNDGRGGHILDESPPPPVIKEEKVEEKPVVKEEVEETNQRTLRSVPGLRAIGKHWDMHDTSSSSDENSDDNQTVQRKVKVKKEPVRKNLEETKKPGKRKRKRNEVVMDLKDMVVRKRMASLNATAILAASYSQEKRPVKSPKSGNSTEETDETDHSSDAYLATDDEDEKKIPPSVKTEDKLIEVRAKPNKKVAVIVNQDTDVTITGVYVNSTTRSTHHEGYCSIAGMQYRISATSHTQTAATAVATETLLQSSSSSAQENSNSESLTSSCKSYTPLDALSNMQPPSTSGTHQNIGPTHMAMPSHQISPGNLRPGCNSAFSAPHPGPYHGAPVHSAPSTTADPAYVHGYYQPAGPLITVPHGHGQPPLTKSAPLSDASPTSVSPLPPHPTHPAPSSNGGDSSDSEVIITSVTAGKELPHPPQPPTGFRYAHQYPPGPPPPPGYNYPYASHYYHPPPPPAPSYAHHDLCYSPGPYLHHKYSQPSATYRRYLSSTQYYPTNSSEIYGGPPPTPTQASQQVVTAPPTTQNSNFQPSLGPPPTIIETYPPTLVETYPAPYYPGYSPAPPPSTCYSHSPARSIPYINTGYQSCPCPMQSCPKNGLTGPLTGDSKRSVLLSKDIKPLPPVALALPLEPASETGPPSPARGSAGMPPPPSPAGATYQPPPQFPPKQESVSPDSQIPTAKKRKARVGKAMVRSTMQNTMLLMCNPAQNYVKREIESPKEKETFEQKQEIILQEEVASKPTLEDTTLLNHQITEVSDITNEEPSIKVEDNSMETKEENEEESTPMIEVLEPIVSTVAENVKVKNMKRKSSMSTERKEESAVLPKKLKFEQKPTKVNGSYKSLIKRDVTAVKITNGKRKLVENKMPNRTKTQKIRLKKPVSKRKFVLAIKCIDKDILNNNNNNVVVKKNKNKSLSTTKDGKEKENKIIDDEIKDATVVPPKIKVNLKNGKKLAPVVLDNLIAKNNIDRTIESVISGESTRTAVVPVSDKCVGADKSKETKVVKEHVVKDSVVKESVFKESVVCKKEVVRSVKPAAAAPSSVIPTAIPPPVVANKKSAITSLIKNPTKKDAQSRVKCKRKSKDEVPVAVVPLSVPRTPRRSLQAPKWSNGWNWEGTPYDAKVFLNSDETTIVRKCYPAMRHFSGDIIEIKDCVLLKAGPRKNDLPFVAKIASLWENPEDGEMMMSLLWYYRPEHTEQGRLDLDQIDEVFASRHKDSNSVACIDDKCYVLTFNEYCRYRKHLRCLEEGMDEVPSFIPMSEPYPRSHRQPPHPLKISPDMVFFCRRVYDFRQKRIIKNPT